MFAFSTLTRGNGISKKKNPEKKKKINKKMRARAGILKKKKMFIVRWRVSVTRNAGQETKENGNHHATDDIIYLDSKNLKKTSRALKFVY